MKVCNIHLERFAVDRCQRCIRNCNNGTEVIPVDQLLTVGEQNKIKDEFISRYRGTVNQQPIEIAVINFLKRLNKAQQKKAGLNGNK